MYQDAKNHLICPHCLKVQSKIAIDFTIAGRVGENSTAYSECESCHNEFGATNVGNEKISVMAI